MLSNQEKIDAFWLGYASKDGHGAIPPHSYGLLLDPESHPVPCRDGQTYIESDPRFYRHFTDPRPMFRLMGDEFGTVGSGPYEDDDPYFGVGTVGFVDLGVAYDLITLAADLRQRAGATIGQHFSAKSDHSRTRREVFDVLSRHGMFVDVTYVDRRALPQYFRNDAAALYRALWFDHLLHVLPNVIEPESVVYVYVASMFFNAKQRQAFFQAYIWATGFSLAPFYYDFLKRAEATSSVPGQRHTLRGLPALAFAEVDPKSNRLAQAADYLLWAVHRELRELPDSHFDDVRRGLRSLRQLTFQSVPGTALMGVAQPTGDPALDDFLPLPRYSVGPSDSFQALHSARQAAIADDAERAFNYLLDVNAANLASQGRAIHQTILRTVAGRVRDRSAELLALMHLTFDTKADDLETIRIALFMASDAWAPHPKLALIALRRLLEIVDADTDRLLADAGRYRLALCLKGLGDTRGAHKQYAAIVGVPRDSATATESWARACVNLANVASTRSPQYARSLLETMLEHVPVHAEFVEPRAKGSVALARLALVTPSRRLELLLDAKQVVDASCTQSWTSGFEPILKEALAAAAG